MSNSVTGEAPDRLSVSRPKKAPPRALTADEMATIRRVADTLIPAGTDMPAGSSVRDFDNLVTRAAAILDKTFPQLVAILEDLSTVPPAALWNELEKLSNDGDPGFHTLSTTIVGAYIYSDEVRQTLNYPTPHRNPPGLFDAADELSSGILDQVTESGFTYVRAD